MNRVLVIVVTYNGIRWLDRCLGSVRSSEMPSGLFVWDNGSTDGSADFVERHFPEAELVRSEENLGFAEANNRGMRYALERGYDFVYLLNQDAWVEPGTLGTLAAVADAHPEFAVLSPLQMTDGFAAPDRQFARIPGLRDLRLSPDGQPVAVSRVMAAHWLIPRRALEKVGLFDSLFPIYGNDDNWCDRARYHGFKVAVVPSARAVHDRAYRRESKERIIERNYRTGSLCRLCDVNRPLWERFLFVSLFTLVKTVRYRSLLPVRHFFSLCRLLPAVRQARRRMSGHLAS